MDTTLAEIKNTKFADALSERYLAYALSTIMSRSLPDVRDGLKPVHRRLLYAMRQLRLSPTQGYKKSARVVGDVMGKFHPHGDSAIYDSMVRLAQDFAQRYPLIDGQGNFGNIDGDNAAAMRYTEARLTEVAERLLSNIDEDTVDFKETYDAESQEPQILPSVFPNLLANGAHGIAVGMATSIPPHNVEELCNGLSHLIKHPNASFETLVNFIPGPDFPTGGILVEDSQNVVQAYSSGRGSFRLRAKWELEKLKNGLFQIIVTEIPYQVQKSKLVEKLAELMDSKKVTILGDVRDESAAEMRLVLEPKNRNVDPGVLMESLFRHSDLEVKFNLNLNVLDAEQTPRLMSLKDALKAFLKHRHDILIRRTNFRLETIKRRLEVLNGYLIAYINLDLIIKIIREVDEPKTEIIQRWDLTDNQAEAILNMRLRTLRRLEEIEIRKEVEDLGAEKTELRSLLGTERLRWSAIGAEISAIKREFGKSTTLGRRRTEIGSPPSNVIIPLEAMVEREPITIVCSKMGWIRAIKGHLTTDADLKFKEGDGPRFLIHAETTDKIIASTSNGRFHTLNVDKLPKGRGHGEPLRLLIDLANDQDLVAMHIYYDDTRFLLASDDGRGFIALSRDLLAFTKSGRQVMYPSRGSKMVVSKPAVGDSLAVVGSNRKLLIFSVAEVPELARGKGVILQRYKDGKLADAQVFSLKDGISWHMNGGRIRTESDLKQWVGRRATVGQMPPTGFPRPPRFN